MILLLTDLVGSVEWVLPLMHRERFHLLGTEHFMSMVIRRNQCPKCGEIFDASHVTCPNCKVQCVTIRVSNGQPASDMEENLDEAEKTFLSKARRYKNNDGKIDQSERNELVDLAMALGLSSVQRESLIERVESEYEKEASKLLRGDSSDGVNRRFAFLDWRRWRSGPLRHVRSFIGRTRNRFSNVGIERPIENQALGGVCAGIGKRFALNVKLLRVLALILAIPLWPLMVFIYFAFWSLMPPTGEKFQE